MKGPDDEAAIGASQVVILAAGEGTRMRSSLPKTLHAVGGAPMLHHAMRAAEFLSPSRVAVVAGAGAEAVERAARELREDVAVVMQAERRGTAHAALQAREALAGGAGDVFVLYGDTPLVRPETLRRMAQARINGASVVVLGFEASDPKGYGRLILDPNGGLDRIVEEREATDVEKAVTLCNSGVVCADAAVFWDLLGRVRDDNAKGEFYLTDIVELARGDGLHAAVVICPEAETLGVNSRAELAAAEAAFQNRARAGAMAGGATLVAPETVFLGWDTRLGRDVIVEPNVVFGPGVTVEDGAKIRAFSHLEGCRVAGGAVIGPYARLRPGAEIGADARVGNFVEIKNAVLDAGAKANHLTYVGDAHVGAGANLGAGTITCNYDGFLKHRTEIGAGAFVGSNASLVAPVVVGLGADVGAGSVVTQDVPDNALYVERGTPEIREGAAKRRRERLAARKAAKTRAAE